MAAAYILSQYAFNHTIRFVTFSGEEEGLLGSHEYAEEADANGDNIVAVLNVDMIGYAITESEGSKARIFENEYSEWITDFMDDVSSEYDDYIGLDVIPSGYSYGSDHYSFWQFGYSATFTHEYKFNPYWHTPDDTIENMNMTYDAKMSKLLVASLAELAQTTIVNQPPNAPTINVTLPTPVAALNQAFVIWSKSPKANDGTYDQNDPIVGELTSTSNLQFRVNSSDLNTRHEISWQVIEFTNSADINVQKGTTSLTSTSPDPLSVDVTLGTPVDVNRTFVLVGHTATTWNGNPIGAKMLRARLIDSNTIRIDRSNSAIDIPEIVWQAVELKDGSGVLRGSESFITTEGQRVVPLGGTIDTNRSIAFSARSMAPSVEASENMGSFMRLGVSRWVAVFRW